MLYLGKTLVTLKVSRWQQVSRQVGHEHKESLKSSP